MNMKVFIKSLTLAEINELSNELYKARKEYIQQNLKTYPALNEEEITLLKKDKIKTIIAYRNRTNLSLVEAKTVIDVFVA